MEKVEKTALKQYSICHVIKHIADLLCNNKSYLTAIDGNGDTCTLTYHTDNKYEILYESSKVTITCDRASWGRLESTCWILEINLGDPDMMKKIENFKKQTLLV